MKKYKFLLKPLFFICSLIFSCWLVLVIEQLSPSDFGKYESLFKSPTNSTSPIVKENFSIKIPKDVDLKKLKKEYLKKICLDYKAGRIDSVKLDNELNFFLKTP